MDNLVTAAGLQIIKETEDTILQSTGYKVGACSFYCYSSRFLTVTAFPMISVATLSLAKEEALTGLLHSKSKAFSNDQETLGPR